MEEITFAVSQCSAEEIAKRLDRIEGIQLVWVVEPSGSRLRPAQRMEPFTYFVVAFAAHLVAGLAHDAAVEVVTRAFADKNCQVSSNTPKTQDNG